MTPTGRRPAEGEGPASLEETDPSARILGCGANEYETHEHAILEPPPDGPGRAPRPRSLCGMAWSSTNPPTPRGDLERCRTYIYLAPVGGRELPGGPTRP